MIISPRTSALVAEKYSCLPSLIAKLEPTEVGHIFKNVNNPHAFFPSIGLFSVEFSLGYCFNMHTAKKQNETENSSIRAERKPRRKKWTPTAPANLP
jgi:hypothetical protein